MGLESSPVSRAEVSMRTENYLSGRWTLQQLGDWLVDIAEKREISHQAQPLRQFVLAACYYRDEEQGKKAMRRLVGTVVRVRPGSAMHHAGHSGDWQNEAKRGRMKGTTYRRNPYRN